MSDEVIENLRLSLKGYQAINQEQLTDICSVERSLPHGHVAAVLGTIKKLGIAKNKISINLPGGKVTFEKITQPTLLQQKALDLYPIRIWQTSFPPFFLNP